MKTTLTHCISLLSVHFKNEIISVSVSQTKTDPFIAIALRCSCYNFNKMNLNSNSNFTIEFGFQKKEFSFPSKNVRDWRKRQRKVGRSLSRRKPVNSFTLTWSWNAAHHCLLKCYVRSLITVSRLASWEVLYNLESDEVTLNVSLQTWECIGLATIGNSSRPNRSYCHWLENEDRPNSPDSTLSGKVKCILPLLMLFGGHTAHQCGQIQWCCGTSSLGVVAFTQEMMNVADCQLQSAKWHNSFDTLPFLLLDYPSTSRLTSLPLCHYKGHSTHG